jgi:hypothetical protein
MPVSRFPNAIVRPELATYAHLKSASHTNTDNKPNRFPLADVFWTLAMAIDVFLIVFYKYDAAALRKLEWKYATVITALCGIPATTFLFIHTPAKGHIYGSVTVSALA